MNKGTRWGRKKFFSSYTVCCVGLCKMIISALSNGVTATVRAGPLMLLMGALSNGVTDSVRAGPLVLLMGALTTPHSSVAEMVGLDLQSKRH